jgi:hypothetical protein
VSGTRPRMTCQAGHGSGGSLERFTLFTVHTLTICGEDDGPPEPPDTPDLWETFCRDAP